MAEAKKAKRLEKADMFHPSIIMENLAKKEEFVTEINSNIGRLRKVNLQEIIERNIDVPKEEILILLASVFSFKGMALLTKLINHVPSCYNLMAQGSSVPLRLKIIHSVLNANGVAVELPVLNTYITLMECYCSNYCVFNIE